MPFTSRKEYDGRYWIHRRLDKDSPGGFSSVYLADDGTREKLSREQRVQVVADVLRGLSAAHLAGVVHRDIKPGNILLDGRGGAKIADFGLAFDPDEPPLTRPRDVLGTEHWMAPEQARGEPADPRDDLFSAGLLLYYLLTNQPPRAGDPTWRLRLDLLDLRFRDVVRRATAERREDRYRSADEMLAHLEFAGRRQRPAGQKPPRRLQTLNELRQITDPGQVHGLFRKLGYPVVARDDLVPIDAADLDLAGAAAESLRQAWTLVDLDGELFVLLLELKDTRGSTIRSVATQFLHRPAHFLLVCTDTYERLIFVNLRRAGRGRLDKLVVDRQRPTRHALNVLEQLAAPTDQAAAVSEQQGRAFDVDQVTESFYREYAGLVRAAQEKIRGWNRGLALFNDERALAAFTQRLFSRILFLYFLQKKGWLAGQADFLTLQYRRSVDERQNFYQDVLKPLFFEVLNTDRPRGESPFGTIPYLNGSLFDRDVAEEQVFLDNELFDDQRPDGILGFLNDYDFTIEEDTPAEVEVALDPEMLGKVFENLLEERQRQQSGVFYTPRPIVHYMCRESLLLYLADRTGLPEDELRELFEERESYTLRSRDAGWVEVALQDLRVLDPAVGSGAFLVGMLHELVQVRRSCKQARGAGVTRTDAEAAAWKREIIQRSLYGVDIKSEAVEIARLRLWLALVVDLEARAGDVEPLPNLDFHVRQGNSLLEGFENGNGSQGYAEMSSNAIITDRERPGFDIVIANPPYVRVQDVNQLGYKDELEKSFGWLDDLYAHFLFRGFDLSAPGGIVAYITADSYFTIGSKQRVRDLLLDHELVGLARCDPFQATVDTAVAIARNQPSSSAATLLFANGNGRPAAAFDALGPEPDWIGERDVTLDAETQAVQIGPADPLPRYQAPVALYRQAVKRAFFEPSPFNLTLYERFMPPLRALSTEWWPRIQSSGAVRKNAVAIQEYVAGLKPGDVTLLGLITEGGQGLATADNPRFLAHLVGTPWGEKNEATLSQLEEKWRTREPGIWRRYEELRQRLPRYEAVDELRRLMRGRPEEKALGIGRTLLYRVVNADQVADPDRLTDDEKRNGIDGPRCWAPFRKGDRAGNRWLSDEPLFIRWDRATVSYFKDNSGKPGANMPVVRNPHLYFQESVSFDRRGRDAVIKTRLLDPCVFDAGTPALAATSKLVPAAVLLAILNSFLSTWFCKAFLNNTNFELNDVRMLPIVVPDDEQRERLVELVQEVMDVQRQVLTGALDRVALVPVESAINAEVLALYGIDPAEAPAGR